MQQGGNNQGCSLVGSHHARIIIAYRTKEEQNNVVYKTWVLYDPVPRWFHTGDLAGWEVIPSGPITFQIDSPRVSFDQVENLRLPSATLVVRATPAYPGIILYGIRDSIEINSFNETLAEALTAYKLTRGC